MNNHHTPARRPTARCQTYAALLPILDEPDMHPDALAEARAHLSACAYCQEQRAAYRQLAVAARRYLGPPTTPRYQTDEIIRDLLAAPIAEPIDAQMLAPGSTAALPRKPRGARRLVSTLAPIAAVLVIVLIAVTLFANRAHIFSTSAQNTAPIPKIGPFTWLYDISMVSSTEGWAVGDTEKCTGDATSSSCTNGYPLIMHYHQGAWTPVAVPFTSDGQHEAFLQVVQMLSATDGWASGPGHLLHYDGHSWNVVDIPPALDLLSLHMFSDSDGWAIGGSNTVSSIKNIMHFDGKTWSAQTLPASLGITSTTYGTGGDLSMISPTEGWADYTVLQSDPTNSSQFTAQSFILHYTAGVWKVQTRIPGNTILNAISMSSASDGWAVGQANSFAASANNSQPALLFHYSNGVWTQAESTIPASGDLMSMTSATDGWMVGENNQALLHYTGGQWRVVPFSAQVKRVLGDTYLISALHMTSASEGWAVGAADHHTAEDPPSPDGTLTFGQGTHFLVFHYHNSVWSVVTPSS